MNKPILTTITIFTVCLAATVLAGIYYFAPEEGNLSSQNNIPKHSVEYVQPSYDSLIKQINDDREEDRAYYDEQITKANKEIEELKSRETIVKTESTIVSEIDDENVNIIVSKLEDQARKIKEIEDKIETYYDLISENNAKLSDQDSRIRDNYNYLLADEKMLNQYYNEIIKELENLKKEYVTYESLTKSQEEQNANWTKDQERQNAMLKDSQEKQNLDFTQDQDRQDNRFDDVSSKLQDQIDSLKKVSSDHVTKEQLEVLKTLITELKTIERPLAYVDPFYPQDVQEDIAYQNQRLNTKYKVLQRLLYTLKDIPDQKIKDTEKELEEEGDIPTPSLTTSSTSVTSTI